MSRTKVQLVGDAQGGANFAGIVTATSANVGSGITLSGTQINVGSATTIHSNGFRIGSSDLHSSGVTLQNANILGVVTATSIRLNGQTLFNGVGIGTFGVTVGTGVTFIDLRGAGISTVTVSSGIATINVTGGGGGGGGGFSPINFILS